MTTAPALSQPVTAAPPPEARRAQPLFASTSAGIAEVPVYDPDTHETNVPGLYVAGHFTHARHIKQAIAVPRRIIPLIAQSLISMQSS